MAGSANLIRLPSTNVIAIDITKRTKASFVVRKLKEYGWIDTEETNSYKEIINFNDYAVKIIEALDKILKNEKLEYQGYVFSIYSLLFNEEAFSKPSIVIENIVENTSNLISGLKILNSSIKKYMDGITKYKTPQELMETVFDKYTTDIIDKSYHRLKTSDNVSKFRPRIISRLQELLLDSSFIENTALELVKTEKVEKPDEGQFKVRESLNYVIEAFQNIDLIINEIDIKNSNYMRKALTRAKFLLSNSNDLQGQINSILKYISNSVIKNNLDIKDDMEEEYARLFSLYPQDFIDETSLYTAAEGKKEFVPESIKLSKVITKEEREQKRKEIQEKNKQRFSSENINNFVMSLLKDKNVVAAHSIELNTVRDFIRLIYIMIYSKSPFAKYEIKKLDTRVDINTFNFRDFQIWRKNNGKRV